MAQQDMDIITVLLLGEALERAISAVAQKISYLHVTGLVKIYGHVVEVDKDVHPGEDVSVDPVGSPVDVDPVGSPVDVDPVGSPVDDPVGSPVDDPVGSPVDVDPVGSPVDVDPVGSPVAGVSPVGNNIYFVILE